jgi:hypothetical protein
LQRVVTVDPIEAFRPVVVGRDIKRPLGVGAVDERNT